MATEGLPSGATGTIGELWCTYQIAFFKPQLSNADTLADEFSGTTGISNTVLCGSDQAANAANTLGGSLSGNTYTFPATARIGDLFYVNYYVQGSSATLTTGFGQTLSGVSATRIRHHPGGSTSAIQFWLSVVEITAGGTRTVQLTGATFPTSPTFGVLSVTKINNDMF